MYEALDRHVEDLRETGGGGGERVAVAFLDAADRGSVRADRGCELSLCHAARFAEAFDFGAVEDHGRVWHASPSSGLEGLRWQRLACTLADGHGRARATHTGNYVQVRYPRGGRWVTVAVSDTRSSAAKAAANAYRERRDPRGQTPSQVRIVSAAQLVREGGEHELRIADAELIAGTRRAAS